MPVTKNVKGVIGFLGLTGYYQKFIANYGQIARPLIDLNKKNGFQWNSNALAAFEALKRAITSAPVLVLPNFEIPFKVECDASGKGVDAVLIQLRHPIAFFSKAFSTSKLSKSVYEKELMALVMAVQHWWQYLLGRRSTIYTDQKSLKYLLKQRITTENQQEWMTNLLGFQFDVVYKARVENKVADALSRQFENAEFRTLLSWPAWKQGKEIDEEVKSDSELQKVIEDIGKDPNAKPSYSIRGERLFYKNRLVIFASSTLIPLLLEEFHSSPQGGHSGFLRTYRRLAANLY